MQQWYQCPRCGAPVAFGARFCGACGALLVVGTKEERRGTSPWLIFLVVLIAVVFLIGGVLLALGAGSQATTSPPPSSTPSAPASVPVINSFVANPASITAGSSSTLRWDVSGATSVAIDHGIGSVPASGNAEAKPSSTTTYTLTVTNAAGSVARTITITVSALLSPDIDFTVFTDPIGKFSVEYPSGWFIDSVSGEDAPHLSFFVVLEPDLEWDEEIDVGFVYDYHSLIGNAKWFNDMFVYLADEDLISTNSYTIGDLTCWECKKKTGETISVLIDCDWEGGLLHLSYGYPIDTLTETEIDILEDYASHMLSTFRVYDPSISERELNILKLVNEHRQLDGLCALELNEFMSDLAREHSNQQSWLNKPLQKGLGISHEGFDERAEKIFSTLGASVVGENVALGYDSSASVVEAWMNSPGHKENILDPRFKRTGIGSTGFFENPIYTQIFSD